MNETGAREEALFEAALRLPAGERAGYLDQNCGDDAALGRRVEALLAAFDRAGDFLNEAAIPTAERTAVLPPQPTEKPGNKIGRYKLLEQIGEGGCGVVYVAQQEEPVRRRVALKVIKLGMDTKQVIARFDAERQALAMMDHANIAKVFDAGTTDTSRPYFVMELVRGIKITDYCDQNCLPQRERLDLFIQVCRAIQHAHQKGVIHRDIKPSNILVALHDGVPVPKVIDFGIAKATQDRLTDQTVYTAFDQFIGTPAYMSPEQMSGLDIDTRSDIYSLGVLLYELLTGKTPFDAKELLAAGLDEMRRTVREVEPIKPSTRLTQEMNAQKVGRAAPRATSLRENATESGAHGVTHPTDKSAIRNLQSAIPPDLDWIVMKCLEKDRSRRYETANGLATDIARHLSNEPIVARPPSKLYRFQKSIQRNKLAFAAAGAVLVTLSLGLGLSTWLLGQERQARKRATAAELEQSRLREAAEIARAGEAKERAKAEQRLYDSLVNEGRAARAARRVGYRERVFTVLQQANALTVPQKDVVALRSEAVACLGDFVGLTPSSFDDFPKGTSFRDIQLNQSGRLAAFALSDGAILLRELPSGRTAGILREDSPATSIAFGPRDSTLFSVHSPDLNPLRRRLAESTVCTWAPRPDGDWQQVRKVKVPGASQIATSAQGAFLSVLHFNPTAGELVNAQTLDTVQRFEFVNRWNAAPFVALSPDGRLLAAESAETAEIHDSAMDIWDLTSGRKVDRLRPRLGQLGPPFFTGDGRFLFFPATSGSAIYSVEGLQRVTQFRAYCYPSMSFASEPVTTLLAMPLYQQNRVRLWNWISDEDVAVLEEPEVPEKAFFTPEGSFLLTCSSRQARLYRLNVNNEKLRLVGHTRGVPGASFSPDGKLLASVGCDGRVAVWDASTGRQIWGASSVPGGEQAVAFSPDGQMLVTGHARTNRLWFWDAITGTRLLEAGSGNVGPVWAVQFSPDGKYVAAATGFDTRVWRIERSTSPADGSGISTQLVHSEPGDYVSLAFSPDGRLLGLAQRGGRVSVWEVGKPTPAAELAPKMLTGVQCLTFSPDSRSLLVVRHDRKIAFFDPVTWKELTHSPPLDLSQDDKSPGPPALFCLAHSPDGTKLAVGSTSKLGVEIWDPRDRRLLYSLPAQPGTVWWLAWTPDSQSLVVSRSDGDISVWRLKQVEDTLAKLGLYP